MWITAVAVLFVLGMILLALEAFVIPGFGLVGILGIASLVGAAAVAWIQLGPLEGIFALLLGVGVTGLLLWYFPRSRVGRAMVLEDVQKGRAVDATLLELTGKVGMALSPLRPAGTAEFGARVVDVVSDGIFVDAGTRVRVARVEGSRVIVEPATDYSGGVIGNG